MPGREEMPEKAMCWRGEGSVLTQGHFFAAAHCRLGPAGLFHGVESAVHERAGSGKVDWRGKGWLWRSEVVRTKWIATRALFPPPARKMGGKDVITNIVFLLLW